MVMLSSIALINMIDINITEIWQLNDKTVKALLVSILRLACRLNYKPWVAINICWRILCKSPFPLAMFRFELH